MEEKEKKPLIRLSLLRLLLVILVVAIVINVWKIISSTESGDVYKIPTYSTQKYMKYSTDERNYYSCTKYEKIKCDYQKDEFYSEEEIDYCEVASYARYLEIIREINKTANIKGNKNLKAKYSNSGCRYLVVAHCTGYSNSTIIIDDIFMDDGSVVFVSREESKGVMADGTGYFVAIPVDLKAGTNVIQTNFYTEQELVNLEKYGKTYNPNIYYYEETSDEGTVLMPIYIEISPTYDGDYDLEYVKVGEEQENDFDTSKCMTYSEYERYCTKWNIDKKYDDETQNYVVVAEKMANSKFEAKLINYEQDDTLANIYTWTEYNLSREDDGENGYIIIVPTDKKIDFVEKKCTIDADQHEQLQRLDFGRIVSYKPVIYIYPEDDGTKVNVKLGYPENLYTTYPKYVDGWTVFADKDGTLRKENDTREYYSLYWEGKNNFEENFEEGFCVKGEDSAAFLEEKLRILGLTDKEAEEFIIYWLPKLEANKYNLIRFERVEEINENMPLDINPIPDTLIRVMMDYKGLNEEVEIDKQVLNPVQREGYTVVEWGGSEIY